MDEQFISFLRALAPYVVVVGSFGRGEERDGSDIDCYLRSRPRAEVDPEAAENNETYMPEVLKLIERHGYVTDSVITGHIAVERQPGVPRMVEISSHYHIRKTEAVSVREVYGVPFLCAKDDKDAPLNDIYESSEWDDKACDMVIKNPLPDYNEAVGRIHAEKKMGHSESSKAQNSRGVPKGQITPLSELPLSNNFMFGEVMRHPEVCTLFLEALLQKKIARIEYIGKEQDISDSYLNHGIRLDVYLADAEGTRYDVEMQRTDQKALERRIRYYQSGIDRTLLEKGVDYEELPESYIIFVCDFDYYKRGLACYERVSTIKGCEDVAFVDGSHAFILNSHYSEANASKDVVEFLDYIRTNDDGTPATGALLEKAKEMVNEVRHDKTKEVAYMTWAMSIRDARKEGREEGREESRVETLCSLVYKKLLAFSDALKESGLSEVEFLGRMRQLYPDYRP